MKGATVAIVVGSVVVVGGGAAAFFLLRKKQPSYRSDAGALGAAQVMNGSKAIATSQPSQAQLNAGAGSAGIKGALGSLGQTYLNTFWNPNTAGKYADNLVPGSGPVVAATAAKVENVAKSVVSKLKFW